MPRTDPTPIDVGDSAPAPLGRGLVPGARLLPTGAVGLRRERAAALARALPRHARGPTVRRRNDGPRRDPALRATTWKGSPRSRPRGHVPRSRRRRSPRARMPSRARAGTAGRVRPSTRRSAPPPRARSTPASACHRCRGSSGGTARSERRPGGCCSPADGRPRPSTSRPRTDRTYGNDEVFGSAPLPYLRPVVERDDGASPLSRWRVAIPLRELSIYLARAGGWDGGRIAAVRGDGSAVTVAGPGGTQVIEGERRSASRSTRGLPACGRPSTRPATCR